MPAITPCFWFDTEGEDAATYWCSVFPNSEIRHVARYGESGPREAGSAMMVSFPLDGKPFLALNGGPEFNHHDESISFVIDCDSQEQVDHYWEKLGAGGGGRDSRCGWVEDRFGISWQVVPKRMAELMAESGPEAAARVMGAMMGMQKLDIAALEAAAAG